jgi:hypothetical protein
MNSTQSLRWRGAILVLTCCCSLPSAALAQGTVDFLKAFTYQGRLDDGARPANGLYDFNFKLHDAETGGAVVGPAEGVGLNAVLVTDGVFSVTLDFGDVFHGGARWLAVAANTNLATPLNLLTPRQQVLPTPYALYAAQSAAVSGGAVDNAALASNAVTGVKIANGSVVRSLNGLTDAVTLAAGSNIILGTVGNVLTISGPGPGAPAWLLGGNGGTESSVNFLGTTDDEALTLRVNNTPALRVLPSGAAGNVPSLVGGSPANSVGAAHGGSVIAGGGGATAPNQMEGGYYSFVGSGQWNYIRDQHNAIVGGFSNGIGRLTITNVEPELNFIGGGQYNSIENHFSVIGGGSFNRVFAHLGTIAGGNFNTVNGESGAIAGGGNNETASFGAVAGGLGNRALGTHSAIGGGESNIVNGAHAVIGGGRFNTADGPGSAIPGGIHARTRLRGQLAHAAGQLDAAGDAQVSTLVLRRRFSGNGELFLDGNTQTERITVPAGAVWTLRLQISAVSVTGTNFASYEVSGMVANVGGTMTFNLMDGAGNVVGTARPIFETPGAVGWLATPFISGTPGDSTLRVAVFAGETVKWCARIDVTEVTR